MTLREEKRALEKTQSTDEFLKAGINQGFEKLNTYWKKVIFDVTPSPYSIATVLAPRLRIAWFKQQWRHDKKYYRKVESGMKAIFELYVERFDEQVDKEIDVEPSRRKTPDGYAASRYENSLTIDTHYMLGCKNKAKKARVSGLDDYCNTHNDHLAHFTRTSDKRLDDPITWWDQVGHKLYPTLYRMALDYLSIPATSCDCERAFSGARRTITCDRNRLQDVTIEALQCRRTGSGGRL